MTEVMMQNPEEALMEAEDVEEVSGEVSRINDQEANTIRTTSADCRHLPDH